MSYADQIGIVPRLLVCSLLAILLAVAASQAWTLRSVAANGLQQAQDSLTISMAMCGTNSKRLGLERERRWTDAAWHDEAERQVRPGGHRQELTGASVTIFLGDTRIATSINVC